MARRKKRYRRRGNDPLYLLTLGLLGIILAPILGQLNVSAFFSMLFFLAAAIICFAGAWKLLRHWLRARAEEKKYQHLRTLEDFFAIDEIEFEHYVAWLYRKRGFHTEVTPPGNDKGIDVYVYENRLSGTPVAAIQVKQYRGDVGRPDVQRFVGSYISKGIHGIFVTTSSFTQTVYDFVKDENLEVELIDGAQLSAMAQAHGVPHFVKEAERKTDLEKFSNKLVLSEEVVHKAYKRGCINDWEREFMLNNLHNTKLTPKQRIRKKKIHRKILNHS